MPLTMNVHNSPPPFLFLPFPNWGGAVEIGRPFVKIRETAIMWRIAYLRERENKLRNLQNSPGILYLSLFSLLILICWHSEGIY